MTDQREAVRSNAKYLRNVRPIDPDEICEYVSGTPHPAVVRQLLREEAVDLGLIERDDGTFVPVDDDPVSPRRETITALPATYERSLEELLADRYGPNWEAGASGDLLRSTIRRFKASYLEGRAVDYDEDVAAGYAIYHLPSYYAAVQYALEDLTDRGLLSRTLRVLDIGAGVGGPALGLCDSLPENALLEYHAVEPSAAADVLETLLRETDRNVHTTIHRTTAEAFDPAEALGDERVSDADAFDLVLACNVLSELAEPTAVARSALEWLAPDGTFLAMAPADKNTSILLRDIERELEDEPIGEHDGGSTAGSDDGSAGERDDNTAAKNPDRVTVYSPTVRLWPDDRPTDRGWSFDVRPDLEVPAFQRRLDEATPASDDEHTPGEFVNVDVQFAYSVLRRDGTRRIEASLETSKWAKMAEMERHVTNRIDLVGAKLSHSLSDHGDHGGANPLFKISDGSESLGHYAVLTNETALNRTLLEADYGTVLSFESILALWNDDEGAYNLVVDEETIVDPVA
ncbi:class I SAM-dependent methyltransferase [Salinadaptatus halalkaliphilus]|uniref:Class I SAM-dependent methyltransferase n=1 Tax=Salinadaptatus halalkaliphilus TaxID=2419781 RepID=A0A4S3TRS0_9EURY|nr:class I SAM-dependent methyltransferase [Salinadaptatus halalkaliphilus]THE66045.1 class I SAM-dependent methyltransferase [Salinadaptatus halalkaliphilus]